MFRHNILWGIRPKSVDEIMQTKRVYSGKVLVYNACVTMSTYEIMCDNSYTDGL